MGSKVIKVARREVRGVTFLPHGQRYEGWVPHGEYAVEGSCLLTVGYGSSEMAEALKITSPGEGTWYVSPAAVGA